MVEIKVDYLNLQFLLYQDGKPVDNPLTAEVQRAVISEIIINVVEEIRRQISHQVSDDPSDLLAQILH